MQLAVPALVGAAVGGLVTAALPEEVLRWLLLSPAELPVAIVLGVAILVGNMLGKRLRPRLGDRTCERVTWLTLLGGVTLAVLGLGRAP